MDGVLGSGFWGKDGSLVKGYANEDGALFIEYRKGKQFYKKKGNLFCKVLSKKLKQSLDENKKWRYKDPSKNRKEMDIATMKWLEKILAHYKTYMD